MPTAAEALYPNGPKNELGNEHPADTVPDISWGEITQHHNSGRLPPYSLPKVTSDGKGHKVVEIEDKTMGTKEKDYSARYKQLNQATQHHNLKDGDVVIIHNGEGNQFGYQKDSRHDDPGFSHFFPPSGLMM